MSEDRQNAVAIAIVLLISIVIVLAFMLRAHAAAPEICKPYARAVTDLVIRYSWMRAYTTCLNSDEDPILPETAIGAGNIIFEWESPPPPPMKPPGSVPATDEPAIDPSMSEAVPAGPQSHVGKSGFARGTKGWLAYCRRYWPASFRASDGTVINPKIDRHRRVPCPA